MIINMVGISRFITITVEAVHGANRAKLVFKDLHSSVRQAYLDFFAFCREDNKNLAVRYFFKLLKDRYP